MTYEETAALSKDQTFRGRVAVGCTKFAAYIVDEAPSTAAHGTRYKWAQNTLVAPDVSANLVMPTLVWDITVQAEGATISDAELQTAIETALQKIM